ncbi:hypothetical protein NM688_g8971 [Phlebia brevispora]|uniref:Uncharacterized protein n=1 Tax=Phlebia brevispora TaxID=194682 RepID=A0ACC1RL39_9APHY|nr:hypothetical protein NM688_g8971 [Phlebia brevispora]
MLIPLVVASVVLLTECASALAVSDRHLALRSVLQARQGFGGPPEAQIPPQCDSQCSVAEEAIQTCETDECLCTNQVVEGLAVCAGCILSVGGPPSAADVAQSQAQLSSFENACALAGDPVSSVTIPASALTAPSLSGGGPTATFGGGGPVTSSFTIPIATGSDGPSIFFSSSGGGAAPPSTPVDTASLSQSQSIGFSAPSVTDSPGSTVSHQTITGSASTDTGALNPTSPVIVSGAQATFGGLSTKVSIISAGMLGGILLVAGL